MNPEVQVVLSELENIKSMFRDHIQRQEITDSRFESRLRALEDWRLAFVSKFTAYSAVALFFGSVVSQIGIYIITQYLKK